MHSTNTIRSLRRRSKLGKSAILYFFSLRAVGHHGLAWKTPPVVALISAVQAQSDVRQIPRGWTVSEIPSTPCIREKRRLRFTPRLAGPPPAAAVRGTFAPSSSAWIPCCLLPLASSEAMARRPSVGGEGPDRLLQACMARGQACRVQQTAAST